MSRSIKKTWGGHDRHNSTAFQKKEIHGMERAREHHLIKAQSRIESIPVINDDNQMFMVHGEFYAVPDPTNVDIDIPRRNGPGAVSWARDTCHAPRMYKLKPNYIDWGPDRIMPLGCVVVNPHTREYHRYMGK